MTTNANTTQFQIESSNGRNKTGLIGRTVLNKLQERGNHQPKLTTMLSYNVLKLCSREELQPGYKRNYVILKVYVKIWKKEKERKMVLCKIHDVIAALLW